MTPLPTVARVQTPGLADNGDRPAAHLDGRISAKTSEVELPK
jgi:hypothetical protein